MKFISTKEFIYRNARPLDVARFKFLFGFGTIDDVLNCLSYYQNEDVVKHLSDTIIGNMDFYEFNKVHKPRKNDFVFLDPPYDSEFSTYAKNEFDRGDQARLADYLIKECKANFMIVIKNTEYISSLYQEGVKTANGNKLYVSCFDKKYFVSFQDRNDKHAQHLLITNYKIGD